MKSALGVVNIVFALATLWFVVAIFSAMRRMRSSQEELVRSLDVSRTSAWFRIALARPGHFRKIWKLLGYEARGVLLRVDDRVRIVAVLNSGERIDRTYSLGDLRLRWLGNAGLGSTNMHWIELGPEQDALMISADTGLNAVPSRQATADICRTIAPDFVLPATAQADFALEKHPTSLAAVVAFFAIVAFAVIDGIVINKYDLVGANHLTWISVSCLLLAVPLYALLSKRGVPSRESIALSMLLGFSIAGAAIPALKRIDQVFADGRRSYEYILKGQALLEPKQSGPPRLHFRDVHEYWDQFEVGSVHSFEFIHGPLGFWQLDRSKLNEATREFYRRRDEID